MNKYFLLLLFLVISCSKDNFKQVYDLKGLRVIAVTAGKLGDTTKAEFSTGDTVVVTPYVSDVQNTRVVTATIETCSDPGVNYGAVPSCENVFDRNATYGSVNLDTSVTTGATGAMPSTNITIPTTIFAGRTSVEQFNGVDYLVTLTISAGGDEIKTFKRLRVTSKSTKNNNPTLGNILFNGNNFTTYPNEGDFRLSTTSGEETFQIQSSNGSISSVTEEMNVAWYVSDGEINFPVTTKNGTTKFKPKEPKSNSLVVVAVLRDNRGGMAVQIKKVP